MLLGEMTKALTISGENIKELRPRIQSMRMILFQQKSTNTKQKENLYSYVRSLPTYGPIQYTFDWVLFLLSLLESEQVNQTR